VLINHDPATRNALNADLYAALAAALDEAQADPQVGAIVLAGAATSSAPAATCACWPSGAAWPSATACKTGRLARPDPPYRPLQQAGDRRRRRRRGRGRAVAGLGLRSAGDARQAQFSVAYVKVGLTPDGGATAFLAQFLPRQVLTQLCLSGERFNGERLHAWARSTGRGGTGTASRRATGRHPGRRTGAGDGRIKHLCQHAYGATLEEQLELEAQHMVLSQGDEAAEGIHAFLENGLPISGGCGRHRNNSGTGMRNDVIQNNKRSTHPVHEETR
jgi:enoyl-CoA hydratase/carnithine racemase